MEKIWLNHYQEGVPAEINPDSYRSIVDLFEQSCAKYGDKTAFVNFGSSMSYAELEHKSAAMAAYFQQEMGLKKGDRLAIMLPNVLQYPVVFFAALRAGLIVVNVNPLYTVDEWVHQMNDAQCDAIVVLNNFAHTVAQGLSKTAMKQVIVTQMGDMMGALKGALMNGVVKYIKKLVPQYSLPQALNFKQVLLAGKKCRIQAVDIECNDIALLQYTGGTTGVAKGAELTHRNLIANVEQISAWLMNRFSEGSETVVTPLPLYHILSLTANVLLFFKFGARNVLITNPRDTKNFIKELVRYPITAIVGVNTLFNTLLNTEGFEQVDFSHLSLSIGGGMAIHESVAKRWKQVTGCTLLEGYGLTETSPVIAASPMNSPDYTGSIGLPLPSTEISLRDEDGCEVAIGEIGELCVRGPQVMPGYWQQTAETQKVFDEQGWFHTGDLVTMDEKGFIRIVDRIKDMILVSGFNVYPNEIEEVIAAHSGVAEVGVIGAENEHSGEMVQAYIVKKDSGLTEQSIIDHCRQHLTAYKIPKKIIFTKELPKTTVGKILRRDLRVAESA